MEVVGRNVEVTPALQQYVSRRLNRLERFLPGSDDAARVSLRVEGTRQVVEVTIVQEGLIFRGEEAAADMYAAIDLVADKLVRQLKKYKTRLRTRRRPANNGDMALAAEEAAVTDTEIAPEDRVVKVKRFALKPQTLDEAIMQMNLLGHSFYVFTNGDSGDVNVLYRRQDGDYGLIEPDR